MCRGVITLRHMIVRQDLSAVEVLSPSFFVRLFLWMRTMKHGTHTIEGNTYSGASSLAEFRAACAQQTLNISPRDIRSNRILENGV
jgi:hypothetical protein